MYSRARKLSAMSALFVFVLFSLSLQNDAKIAARYPRYGKLDEVDCKQH